MSEKTLLVFSGGNDRAVLAFLRALRQCGKRAAIVARTRDDLVFRTRYRRWVVHTREDHSLDIGVFREGLDAARSVCGGGRCVVFPSTEYFNRFLLDHREEIEGLGCEIPLVDAALYRLLSDKRSATEFFRRAGVRVPGERHGKAELDVPVVAKPSRNVDRAGHSLYPQLLLDRRQLDGFLAKADLDEFFFQDFVDGPSFYLLFYISRSGMRQLVWSQRNILQQPDGKSILLAQSSTFHLRDDAGVILGALHAAGFRGLGMVEVILSGQDAVFIEMNPRPWGPLQLCVDARQPLLEALIGDVLLGDAGIPADVGREAAEFTMYGWTNGLLEVLARGGRPVWRADGMPRLLSATLECLGNDVFLRWDSWRCFVVEFLRVVKVWTMARGESRSRGVGPVDNGR